MDLTSRDLRIGIRSPEALASQRRREALNPTPKGTPRNPQRAFIDASIGEYFRGGRDPDILLAAYERRTGKSKRRESAATEIANGRTMLERFLVLDHHKDDPSRFHLRPEFVEVLGHRIKMGVDMAYDTPAGAALALVITDEELRRTEHLRLFATAAMVHFQDRPDGGRVAQVEVWLLKWDQRLVRWPRQLLENSIPRLADRLEEIARGASGRAA
jgi:hypothetical protein